MPKTWLVTGASSGFGLEIARRVLARGECLAATARDPSKLAELLACGGDRVRAIKLDVTDPADPPRAVAETVAAFGSLDVVVNNAGYGLIGALEECDDAQIERNFQTNFFGALRVIRAAMPVFRAQRSGRIINISAAAAISNYAGFSIYGAAKCALEGLSESVAAELAPLGVKVTIVQPGPYRTEFATRSLDRGSGKISDYDGTSGRFAALLSKMGGTQPGDPVRAAELICSMADQENPPLRLVIGKYAINKVRKKLAQSEAELKQWEGAGAATDFPPAARSM